MSRGVGPERIQLRNTIKKAQGHSLLLRGRACACSPPTRSRPAQHAKAAPGLESYVRILTERLDTADCRLSRKFGCQIDSGL